MHSLSFPLTGNMWSASGSKETAHSNHRQYFGGVESTSLPQSHISLLHLKLQLLQPWLPQHSTSTSVKQHCHADLSICINPLLRSPAQTNVLEFNCLPLSHFHSQIPEIYTFKIWYSLSPCHSFLCLESPCHPNSNAKTTGFNTMPTALSMS